MRGIFSMSALAVVLGVVVSAGVLFAQQEPTFCPEHGGRCSLQGMPCCIDGEGTGKPRIDAGRAGRWELFGAADIGSAPADCEQHSEPGLE